IPNNLSFEEASTLDLGIFTASQGLYQSLKTPTANQSGKIKVLALIYGDSTATGAFAMQLFPEGFEFAKSIAELANSLLEQGKIKPYIHEVIAFEAGFKVVLKGLQSMRKGKLSGKKLVYTL
ncbi:hypothetical protein HK100_011799, partial [Physocladia obscura]